MNAVHGRDRPVAASAIRGSTQGQFVAVAGRDAGKAAADAAGRVCIEGLMWRHHPCWRRS